MSNSFRRVSLCWVAWRPMPHSLSFRDTTGQIRAALVYFTNCLYRLLLWSMQMVGLVVGGVAQVLMLGQVKRDDLASQLKVQA